MKILAFHSSSLRLHRGELGDSGGSRKLRWPHSKVLTPLFHVLCAVGSAQCSGCAMAAIQV